ncbi:hypothetical protein VB796_06705 [Arcicella sp. LKC2W]|uniref:hypothetical protein n=1 Tax=Arcicella sp. LKC2W TaxID=2984198 RepID=UPI002B1FFC21|nr:hypothetical protein [Arcicella sp. LKC2W]MEA5458718.1 hypothetical protein [Arcicella sp. LKC2W]
MQKNFLLSANDGCIFETSLSERIVEALKGKENTELDGDFEINGVKSNLYFIDDKFYYAFRADFPDFHRHQLLVAFIQENLGKTIMVMFAEKGINQLSLDNLERCLNFLKLINEGMNPNEALLRFFDV